MSLSDDDTIRFRLRAERAVTWMAFTVRPLSGPVTGICSFRTRVTMPTVTVVLGAIAVGWGITTVPPTWRNAIVVLPVEPAQVVVDVDSTAPILMVGMARIPVVTSATDAWAVDLPGKATVVTLAHRTCAPTSPESVATHGVVVVDEEVVEMGPVSGVGLTFSTRALAVRPKARPVSRCGVM